MLNKILLILLCSSSVMAQDKVLTLAEAFDLALKNSVQLKLSAKNAALVKQQKEIAKLNRLPVLSSGFNYGYISNADIWTPSFSEHLKGSTPHHFTQLSVEAAEVIFRGNTINNSIGKAGLEEQIAFLQLEKNTVDIKFLVAARYLDIYRLLNQRNVYINNTILARHRLENILSLQKQGMVTENDRLRTELTISDLQLSTKKISNNIAILNNQLNLVLGLPDSLRLVPDSSLLVQSFKAESLSAFMDEAYHENHELKISALENKVSETNLKLLRGDRLPVVSLFAGSNLQRPFVYTVPSVDIYYNVWQTGINVRYNIASLYQSPVKIKAGEIALELNRENEVLQKQYVELAIKNTFIKYNESKDELQALQQDLLSADENYRIVEKKYFNQLSLLADLIDASNTKLEAEIKVTNAAINIIYNYYQLLKSTGKL